MHVVLHWVACCAALSVAAEFASPGALAAALGGMCAALVWQLSLHHLVHWLLHWVACCAALVWQLVHPFAFHNKSLKRLKESLMRQGGKSKIGHCRFCIHWFRLSYTSVNGVRYLLHDQLRITLVFKHRALAWRQFPFTLSKGLYACLLISSTSQN